MAAQKIKNKGDLKVGKANPCFYFFSAAARRLLEEKRVSVHSSFSLAEYKGFLLAKYPVLYFTFNFRWNI